MISMSENLFQISNGAKSYGTKILFTDANFAINQHERVGVIGPNGAGKSTLFKILTGSEKLDQGTLTLKNGLRMAILRQDTQLPLDLCAMDYIEQTSGAPVWELTDLLAALDLSDTITSRAIKELSGGYRMRVQLCCLLGSRPDLLLLDEPTNYLDVQTMIVLENLLVNLNCGFLLISHDREFLRRTTDHILEVENGDIIKYPGSIDDYFEQKVLLREQLHKTARSIEEKKQAIKDFAARFGAKATKARAVQSRLKQLDRMDSIDIKPLPDVARINIPQPKIAGKIEIIAKCLAAGYGTKKILENVSFEINSQDRIAIVGENGAGKSTLIKTLAGRLAPAEGTVHASQAVKIAYYAQHVADELPVDANIQEILMSAASSSTTDQEVMNLAGSLLFSGNDILKTVDKLSGGEKARVALGKILLSGATVLILDEPTNHLDFYTVEALGNALGNYRGNVILVSHDQTFVKQVATKIIEVSNGTAETYPGSYDDYIWSIRQGTLARQRQQRATAKNAANVHPATSEKARGDADQSGSNPKAGVAFREAREAEKQAANQRRRLEKRSEAIEKKLTELEIKQIELNEALAQRPGSMELINELGLISSEIQALESEWLEVLSQLSP